MASLKVLGKIQDSKELLKMCVSGSAIYCALVLTIKSGIPSGPAEDLLSSLVIPKLCAATPWGAAAPS